MVSAWRYSYEAYWLPRSEWWIKPSGGPLTLYRHHPGRHDEFGSHMLPHGPANDLPRVEIDDGRKKHPAFVRGYVRYI
jgi:hypothetical protein